MAPLTASPRELIVFTRPGSGLTDTLEALTSVADNGGFQQLQEALSRERATMARLFGLREKALPLSTSSLPELFANQTLSLSRYYRVLAPDDRLEALAEELRHYEFIDSAYIKPGAEVAIFDTEVVTRPEMASALFGPQSNCDFSDDQKYLAAGENGIDTTAAWNINGGYGDDVSIIDIEGAWCFNHSDLKEKQGGMVGGVPINDQLWRDHGTAVLGVLSGDLNGYGVTGICPNAFVRAVSIFGFPDPGVASIWGASKAIQLAADKLSAGDVLVLELHFPGPEAGFKPNDEQHGYIPAEWWPDCAAAIHEAASRNICVIATAGNGFINLDAAIYDVNPGGFSETWRNPLRRDPLDTGSILVGAGAPPNGTHNTAWGPARSRLDFSNYGSMVDTQAWGREVTTTGFQSLCGIEEEYHYTRHFNGTSSATAIVAGAVACLQGIRKAAKQSPLTPRQVRQILRETGSPQRDFPGTQTTPPRPSTERIGNLPNLKQMTEKMKEF